MDSTINDILSIDDSDILLAYELDKLTLEPIPSDILDELSKDDGLHIENVLLPLEDDRNKSSTEIFSKDKKNFTVESLEYYKSCTSQQKQEDCPKKLEKRKDVNGNEEPLSGENLNLINELDKLQLSDSDNEEENEKSSNLRERGPDRRSKRTSRNREQNILARNIDRALINPETLRHLSGSSRIDLNDITNAHSSISLNFSNSHHIIFNGTNPYPSVSQDLNSIISGNETIISINDSTSSSGNCASGLINKPTPSISQQNFISSYPSIDSAYEDCGVNVLSSPESGYESHSLTGSPPLFPFNISESISIPENVDEEDILESLVDSLEYAREGALPAYNPFALGLDEEDCKGIILGYLKDLQPELGSFNDLPTENRSEHVPLLNGINMKSVSSGTQDLQPELSMNPFNELPSENASKSVPLLNDVSLSSVSSGTPSPVLCEISQNSQTPIACRPLNDRARKNLYDILSVEKSTAAQSKIYKKLREDRNNRKEEKVIYIEDEMDKTSELRTNLHQAVINQELEEIYYIVEIHKQWKRPFSDLNLRDKNGKTAFDYAIQNDMTLVAEYLKENNACPSLNI